MSCTRQLIYVHLHIDVFCIRSNWLTVSLHSPKFMSSMKFRQEIFPEHRKCQTKAPVRKQMQCFEATRLISPLCVAVHVHDFVHAFSSPLAVFSVQAVIQSSPPCWSTAGKSRLAAVWSAAGGRLPRCCLDTLLPASSRQPGDTQTYALSHIESMLYSCMPTHTL